MLNSRPRPAANAHQYERPIHRCAVCPKPIQPGVLMCLEHWRRVPSELQRRVYQTWGRLQRASRATATREQLVADYEKARDAAIASVSLTTTARTST